MRTQEEEEEEGGNGYYKGVSVWVPLQPIDDEVQGGGLHLVPLNNTWDARPAANPRLALRGAHS